ncbi:MAG: hypothetical protein U0234_11720 [Sandaracinus sp.]
MRAFSTLAGAALVLLSVGGCVRRTVVPGVTVAPYPAPQTQAHVPPVPYAAPDAIEHVQLIAGMPPATCEVIGLVTAIARPGEGDAALDELRARAAALGADAVVHVRLHVESSPGDESVSGDPEWEAMLDEAAGTWEQGVRVTGEAVRYREPIVEGRRYLVVGRIGVTDRVGHEHEALERLASRARSMRADLVIDIEVTSHGPDSPFEVHGTAIRFIE